MVIVLTKRIEAAAQNDYTYMAPPYMSWEDVKAPDIESALFSSMERNLQLNTHKAIVPL